MKACRCSFILAVAASLAMAAASAQTGGPFAAASRRAAELASLHSLIVSSQGVVVFEYHAKGFRGDRAVNIKSAAKSVISALVGIAIDRGLIPGIHEPIVTYFPELKRDRDLRKQKITVEDLLTMRAGLEPTSGRNYGAWVTSRNWVSYALGRPIVSEPGAAMQYSTGSSHLLSAILTMGTAGGSTRWAATRAASRGASAASTCSSFATCRPSSLSLPRRRRATNGTATGGSCSA